MFQIEKRIKKTKRMEKMAVKWKSSTQFHTFLATFSKLLRK